MATAKAGKPESSPAMSAVIVLLLTLVGAGAGIAAGAMLKAPAPVQSSAGAATGVPQETVAAAENRPTAAVPDPETMATIPFPPILTNLAEPKGTWIRIEGSLLIRKESLESKEIIAERADEQIVTFLRTVKLNEIEGPSGFLSLREDLNDLVSALSGGKVKEVLIHSMVLE